MPLKDMNVPLPQTDLMQFLHPSLDTVGLQLLLENHCHCPDTTRGGQSFLPSQGNLFFGTRFCRGFLPKPWDLRWPNDIIPLLQ